MRRLSYTALCLLPLCASAEESAVPVVDSEVAQVSSEETVQMDIRDLLVSACVNQVMRAMFANDQRTSEICWEVLASGVKLDQEDVEWSSVAVAGFKKTKDGLLLKANTSDQNNVARCLEALHKYIAACLDQDGLVVPQKPAEECTDAEIAVYKKCVSRSIIGSALLVQELQGISSLEKTLVFEPLMVMAQGIQMQNTEYINYASNRLASLVRFDEPVASGAITLAAYKNQEVTIEDLKKCDGLAEVADLDAATFFTQVHDGVIANREVIAAYVLAHGLVDMLQSVDAEGSDVTEAPIQE